MPRYRNPCTYLPRRLQVAVSLTAVVLFCILFIGGSSRSDPYLEHVPLGPQLERGMHKVLEQVPYAEQLNPFGPPIHHPPPEQSNSSSGNVRWFSDFKWRNPFSSSTTLDEERAVLPPPLTRPPVYTYFDPTSKSKDEKSRQAEQDLLQIWMRAWWAQGFKPIVLGRPEATNNPMYHRLQGLDLRPEFELELMRWLAWGSMGTGIMCNWLALPMAPHDDPLLSKLRKGDVFRLTRYDGLDNALFVGLKAEIDHAITTALASPKAATASTIWEAAEEGSFFVETEHESIAFYSTRAIGTKYPSIKEYLDKEETRAAGLAMLPPLINAHLQNTWQTTFSSGIAVLKPIAQNTTALVEPAIELARNLSQCSISPLPTSCPPNLSQCKPCVSSQGMRILTPPIFRNTSTLFTIGVVPHPFTLQSLIHTKGDLNLPFIRRKTKRDVWISAVSKELLGNGISAFARLAPLKDAVASDFGSSHSYWLTAEGPAHPHSDKDVEELDWIFGFRIPQGEPDNGKSETPVPGPERRPPPPKQQFEGPPPTAATLALQQALIEGGKKLVHDGEPGGRNKAAARIRTIAEAWNLADTEIWKFVRAWNARRILERRNYEDEEGQFLGKGIYERFREYVRP